jgi:hypothetical protein
MNRQLNKSTRQYVFNELVLQRFNKVQLFISINVSNQISIPVLSYCRTVVLWYCCIVVLRYFCMETIQLISTHTKEYDNK